MSIQFSHLIVVGVGLLGASIGLAVRQRGLARTVIGIGRNRSTLDIALRRQAIDIGLTDWRAVPLVPGQTTLAVVCTPVSTIPEMVGRVTALLGEAPETLITDVGSTKESICRTIADPRFIGSHPIAGSEKTGPEFGDSELFQGRTTILTPTERNRESDVERIERFWTSIGSRVVRMDARRHDEILAVTSHLPHALSATLQSVPTHEESLFSGTGFLGMTRLAAGSPEVWGDIFTENRDSLLAALCRFEDRLHELVAALEAGDKERIVRFLADAGSR